MARCSDSLYPGQTQPSLSQSLLGIAPELGERGDGSSKASAKAHPNGQIGQPPLKATYTRSDTYYQKACTEISEEVSANAFRTKDGI
jgi:hypothetical protein